MRKILFIMSEFPPIQSPTDICVCNIIESLSKNYQVFCLSEIKNSDSEIAPEITSYSIKSKFDRKENHIKKRIRQIVHIPFYPNNNIIDQIRLNKRALKICKENDISIVVSVCFQFCNMVAGDYVKKKIPSIKHVPYYIDAFSSGTMPKYLPYVYAFNRRLKLEKRINKNSDSIVMMEASRRFHEKYNNELLYKMIFLNPPLLKRNVSILSRNNQLLENGIINLVFSGYLYFPDRDPRKVINMIDSLQMENICITFIGNGPGYKVLEEKGIAKNILIRTIPYMEHNKLLSVLDEADFLINLGVSNSNAVSGKIFEYMALGKPIITLYFDDDDASLQYLQKYPLSICIKENESNSNNLNGLKSFILNCYKKSVGFEYVYDTFYTSTPECFIENVIEAEDE